jgi:polyhydroxyalkanoate synthesis regulator phasin
MKAKTILELMALSSSFYAIAKDTELMDKLKEVSKKGKDKINKVVSEPVLDEDGNELEFVEKMIHKAGEAKEELEHKIEELVAKFYKKINIAHLDEVRGVNEKLDEANKSIALLEAGLKRLEAKQ